MKPGAGERGRPAPPPDVAPRSDVHVAASPTRCPFCHDEASAAGSVACQGCLARHHAACWDEGGRCATCGGAFRLVAPDDDAVSAAWEVEASEQSRRAVRGLQRLILGWQGLRLRRPCVMSAVEVAAFLPLLWVEGWGRALGLVLITLALVGGLLSARSR
ncbi:MAG: hypothetical protein KF878_06330 [Planctomycetes bacterium]|nr:hypothetical protein [Planctomycetota bacterium]